MRPSTRASEGRLSRHAKTTGPLTIKRMGWWNEEVTAGALKFMDKAVKDGKAVLCLVELLRMHVFTHLT